MTLPPTITPADMEQARALLRVRVMRQKQLAQLKCHISAADRVSHRASVLLNARLDFKNRPGLLGGLAECLQRNHPKHHDIIQYLYRWLLRDMIEPLRLAPGLAAPRPHMIDFAALRVSARPYLIGVYCGIHQNNRFAEVDLLQSRPLEGHIVMMQTGGPIDLALWQAHLPAINAWLTASNPDSAWTITSHTASTVTLTRQPKLPSLIPFHRTYLAHGALFVGIDVVQRTPVYIPFADLTAGTYIPGAAGTGKTSALHVLLRSIFANLDLFSSVVLCDGKDGVGMQRYARLHPKVTVLYDEPQMWQLAADINALMRNRNAEQRALGIDKATKDFIAVVIDELPTFIAKPAGDAKKEHAVFLDNLQRIAMRGRSAGIRMFLISQSPVAEQIPVNVRTNCSTVISFRLPENSHATAVFGTLDATNDPRKLGTGQAVVLQGDTGKITRVQFPFAPLYQPRPF